MKEQTKPGALALGLIWLAFKMRAALTGVGPLTGFIQQELGLSAAVAGFLTTIPLLAFAALSPLVGGFAAHLGEGRAVFAGCFLLAGGILVRSYLGAAGLFAGTLFIGSGIVFFNVLIPALIKGLFAPGQAGALTSAYTTAMAVFAGAAAGASVPLANAFGWRNALAVWALLALVGAAFWAPFRGVRLPGRAAAKKGGLFRSPVARWAALYMGVQSFLFYCFVAWLPAILAWRGFGEQEAGYWASVYQLLGILSSFTVPLLACRFQEQKWVGAGLSLVYLLGVLCIFVPSKPVVMAGVVFTGFCAGGFISYIMLLFGLRTRTPADAARLSGSCQAVGYTIAAVGPLCMGSFYDALGSWELPLTLLCAMSLLLALAGWQAGRDRFVGEEGENHEQP
ncbi:MAG: MFS transporter [Oscillospiraceae bacterium]|nr:MFS transporter [Oscillospiraceae bacterium]